MHKKKSNKIIVLIPSFNELKTLKKIINSIKKKFNVMVVNDCSTDGTKIWLVNSNIKHLNNKKNLGYEKSLIRGFKYIIKYHTNVSHIVTMDADGEHKPRYLSFIEKNLDQDILIANRDKKNRFLEKLIEYFFFRRFRVFDPLSGLKVYKKKLLKKINLSEVSSNFFLVDVLVKLLSTNNIKTKNFKIIVGKRKDQPRVGGFFKANYKLLKILYILTK